MSRKLTAFRLANIAPKTTCNYAIWIPSILTSPVAIEAATIPKVEIASSSFSLNGQTYNLPVRKITSGSWSCTMNENLFLTTMYQALYKQHTYTNADDNKTNQILSVFLDDIYIFITDEVSGLAPVGVCVLKNCYMDSIGEIKLSAAGATEIVKIQLTFKYNGIDDCYRSIDNVVGFEEETGVSWRPFAISGGVAAITTAAWATLKGASELEGLIKSKRL